MAKQLNFALVGCGSMAHWHAQQLQKIPEVKVVALVDPVQSHTAEFKQKFFSDAVEFQHYEHLLEQPPVKLDAVVLVTPHVLHHPQAREALQRDIHVLCEKPMVTTYDHALDLAHLVKQHDKKLGITAQGPYTREYQCLARMRDSGQLGKITLLNGWISQSWTTFTHNTWRQDAALSGGGMLFDTGAHVLNAMIWLTNSPVVEVAAFNDNAGTAVEINNAVILKFASGALASVSVGGTGPGWDTNISIQTEKLVAKTAPHGGWLDLVGPHGKKIYPHIPEDEHPAAGSPHLNFVNAILGLEQLILPVRYGVMLVALMEALHESVRTGSVKKVRQIPIELES